MDFPNLQLFHDTFERIETACDMLWFVSERFHEAGLIAFTEQSDDKCFQRKSCDSGDFTKDGDELTDWY